MGFSMTTTPTILIHGLHQNRYAMYPLAYRLKKDGFTVHCHGYHCLKDSIATHSQGLNDWLNIHHSPNAPLNFVAHSLGGLVLRDFIARYPKWQIGRAVTLGTPHQGSLCADYTKRLIPWLIGKSYEGALDGHCLPLPEGVDIGVIAGNKPYGLGLPFLLYHQYKHGIKNDHDGTVFLSESILPTTSDYLVMPVTHSGFLTNKKVAKQVGCFLQNGCFFR